MVVLSFNPRPVCVGSKRNIESIQCIHIYTYIYIYIHTYRFRHIFRTQGFLMLTGFGVVHDKNSSLSSYSTGVICEGFKVSRVEANTFFWCS